MNTTDDARGSTGSAAGRDRSLVSRITARLMASDNPAFGDERERAVFMESSTFGQTLGICLSLLAAFVAALLGQLLLPVVLVVMTSLPTFATIWYAGRKGVDVYALAERADRRSGRLNLALVFGGLLLTLAAMLYAFTSGQGIIPMPDFDPMPSIVESLIRGALQGGIAGCVIGAVMMLWLARKSERAEAARALRDAEAADDDL